MDNKTNIEELKHIVNKFCEERDWGQFHNPKDLAIGITTEASELLDLFRFKSEAQVSEIMSNELKRERVAEELADVFFLVLRFAQMHSFDLNEVLISKIEKNNKKYPVETSKGSNIKHNEVV